MKKTLYALLLLSIGFPLKDMRQTLKLIAFYLCCCYTVALQAQVEKDSLLASSEMVKCYNCMVTGHCSGVPSGGCSRHESYSLMILADSVQLFGDTFSNEITRKSLNFKKGTLVNISVHSYNSYEDNKIGINDFITQTPAISYTNAQVNLSFSQTGPPMVYTCRGKKYKIEIGYCVERITCAP